MNQQELNKKLAEWAGFKETPSSYAGREFIWQVPDGSSIIDLPNFTNSLDACFKWLVPKLKVDEDTIMFAHPIESMKYYCEIIDADGEPIAGSLAYKAPALALCLAIEKLIDSEVASAPSG